MYAKVPTAQKRLVSYEPVVGAQPVTELRALAAPLRGAHVLHLTWTAFGSGAPEELTALVPLMNDLGLRAEWQVVRGSAEFGRVGKAIGDALGGLPVRAPRKTLDVWRHYNEMNACLFDGDYDFVVVHGPQPAGIPKFLRARPGGRPSGKWIWHCHDDLASAHRALWALLRADLDCCYDAAVFAAAEFVRHDLDVAAVFVVPPAIDPFSTKNMEIDLATQRGVVERYGIDPARLMLFQIVRFIKWADPDGVIEAYRLAKHEAPELQLVLLWAMPGPNAESARRFEELVAHAGDDPDVHLLSNLNEVGNLEQNALERSASVVVHRSLRSGFAVTVAEASWKGRPVVANRIGVMPGQIIDGRTGCLHDTVKEMAECIVGLLKDRQRAEQMGAAGREHVRANFLITRELRDYLQLFRTLQAGQAAEVAQ